MNRKVFKFFYHFSLLLILIIVPIACGQTVSETELWEVLKAGDGIALMRHATAPGTGDPDNFQLNDCSTQRNLSEEGREQACLISERFCEQGISEMAVYSSQWCRCLETATSLNLGEVTPLPDLNSFFENQTTEEAQTVNIREFISSYGGGIPLMLVTHQVNITALTSSVPASGEIIVLRKSQDGFEVLGSFVN
jgi:phosphohistidine phosphatase SixA